MTKKKVSKKVVSKKDSKQSSNKSQDDLEIKTTTDSSQDITPESDKKNSDEEPSWYHYVIILGGLCLIIFGAYFIFEFSTPNEETIIEDPEDFSTFMYKHQVGNTTYNIEFSTSFDEINSLNYEVPVSRLEILNTQRFYFSFQEYSGTDNGFVTYSAIKLRRFLSAVYFFRFQEDQFVQYEDITCENSTRTRRVVVFDVYANQTEIRTDENGCLYFSSESPQELIKLVDTFMYHMIVKE